jgi:chromosomal replication initiation ATPase DnaA
MVLYLGRRHSGLTLRELGEAMGGMDCSAVSGGIIRFGKKLKRDSELRKQVARIVKKCNVET